MNEISKKKLLMDFKLQKLIENNLSVEDFNLFKQYYTNESFKGISDYLNILLEKKCIQKKIFKFNN